MAAQNQNKVSLPVIKRLPKYYRYISDMHNNGIVKVSSSELARMMGTTASQVRQAFISSRELAELMSLTASQIRQDLNCFGGFGQQGIGYHVDVLLSEISKLLFSEKNLNAVLIGTGRLGRAISGYLSAEARGYHLMAAFDKSPDEIGRELQCGVMVQDVAELAAFCAAHHPDVAVLCIPRAGAKAVAPTLVEAGVKGYWNFSHYDLSVDYEGITVENVHLGDSLMSLGYRVRND